ncbi:MAG TPA: hypothetical protein VGI52_00125 [Solirubrobacteraceae bacterium]
MTTALEYLHKELDILRSRVTSLEKAEEILRPAYELPKQQEPAARAQSSTSSQPTPQNPTQVQLCDYIAAHHPITRGELLTALGGNAKAVDKKLNLLLMSGRIGADGRPGRRRYRPPGPHRPAPDGQSGLSPVAPARGVYPMYDEIVDLGMVTTESLAQRTGKPASQIVKEGRKLLQLKLVRISEDGSTRAWFPANPKTKGKA